LAPAHKNIFSIQVSRKRQLSMQGRFLLFSFIVFLLILFLGSVAFVTLMGRILFDNTGRQLTQHIEVERLRLEASVNSEIAVALKIAGSPLIQRYFASPDDPALEIMAFEELDAYRRAFAAQSVFWVNDIDKILYYNSYGSYKVDPEAPDNYWYPMTLYETEVYNFNINFNPDLNVINLWINIPVFDNNKTPIGIVGTGINLSDFISTTYRNRSLESNLYFFNTSGEITGSNDINLVANKVAISEELGQTGTEIAERARKINSDEIDYFRTQTGEAAALGSIPSLGWHVTAVQPIHIGNTLKTGMTVLFGIMMLVILSIFAAFNAFVSELLEPLNHLAKKMSQITIDWNISPNKVYQKDEIKTLSEFLEVAITMMNEKLQAEREAHESGLAMARAEAAREAIVSSIEYASKIQKNLLPPDAAFRESFSDYCVLWKPRDIVGGDIYWIKKFDRGTILCVCDCTGHGTPGAMLTMLVVSIFEAIVTAGNCSNTAQIVWGLEKRLVASLNVKAADGEKRGLTINDGCDLAVLFIAQDGNVTVSSSHTRIFICDGKNVKQLKGQNIHIGDGKLKHRDEIETVHIPANPDNKFYIASDGLYDQPGGPSCVPFGYGEFKEIILENHNEDLSVTAGKAWEAFERYRGTEPRVDDVELIAFKP